MPPQKRKSYTIQFKIEVLLNAQETGNISKTARDFGVHRKQVNRIFMNEFMIRQKKN